MTALNKEDRILVGLVRGRELQMAGYLSEAEQVYALLLGHYPDDHRLLHMFGIVLGQLGQHARAIDAFQACIRLKPDDAVAHHNLARSYIETSRPRDAILSVEAALGLNPAYVRAYCTRADALVMGHRFDLALLDFERALLVDPSCLEARLGRVKALMCLGKNSEAEVELTTVSSLFPDSVDPEYHLGQLASEKRKFQDACRHFQSVLQKVPNHYEAQGQLLMVRHQMCDWTGRGELLQSVSENLRLHRSGVSTFGLLGVIDDPELHLLAAQQACRSLDGIDPVKTEVAGVSKIKIAYLSADFHSHATAYLMAGVFECHDRNRYEVIALSFGNDIHDNMRIRLQNAFDRFIDVRNMSSEEIALLISNNQVHILVDLKGYTYQGRPSVLAYKPAPIVVSYLGYPGTLGFGAVDYIIGDPIVTPASSQVYYAENIVQLADCYQCNDDGRKIEDAATDRAGEGLPQSGFVFAAFNNPYKILPDVFDIWMRLLLKVEGSVLWLICEEPDVIGNLQREAKRRGVDPVRLVFAKKLPLAQHLGRHQLADLFLDTLPYNAHTTASDALWAGLPVLTCMGRAFAGRVAASLLTALGLPELITESAEDYERVAIRLATQPAELAALKAKLWANRTTSPLFDTRRFTRNLESAYGYMIDQWSKGLSPCAFAVTEQGCQALQVFPPAHADTATAQP